MNNILNLLNNLFINNNDDNINIINFSKIDKYDNSKILKVNSIIDIEGLENLNNTIIKKENTPPEGNTNFENLEDTIIGLENINNIEQEMNNNNFLTKLKQTIITNDFIIVNNDEKRSIILSILLINYKEKRIISLFINDYIKSINYNGINKANIVNMLDTNKRNIIMLNIINENFDIEMYKLFLKDKTMIEQLLLQKDKFNKSIMEYVVNKNRFDIFNLYLSYTNINDKNLLYDILNSEDKNYIKQILINSNLLKLTLNFLYNDKNFHILIWDKFYNDICIIKLYYYNYLKNNENIKEILIISQTKEFQKFIFYILVYKENELFIDLMNKLNKPYNIDFIIEYKNYYYTPLILTIINDNETNNINFIKVLKNCEYKFIYNILSKNNVNTKNVKYNTILDLIIEQKKLLLLKYIYTLNNNVFENYNNFDNLIKVIIKDDLFCDILINKNYKHKLKKIIFDNNVDMLKLCIDNNCNIECIYNFLIDNNENKLINKYVYKIEHVNIVKKHCSNLINKTDINTITLYILGVIKTKNHENIKYVINKLFLKTDINDNSQIIVSEIIDLRNEISNEHIKEYCLIILELTSNLNLINWIIYNIIDTKTYLTTTIINKINCLLKIYDIHIYNEKSIRRIIKNLYEYIVEENINQIIFNCNTLETIEIIVDKNYDIDKQLPNDNNLAMLCLFKNNIDISIMKKIIKLTKNLENINKQGNKLIDLVCEKDANIELLKILDERSGCNSYKLNSNIKNLLELNKVEEVKILIKYINNIDIIIEKIIKNENLHLFIDKLNDDNINNILVKTSLSNENKIKLIKLYKKRYNISIIKILNDLNMYESDLILLKDVNIMDTLLIKNNTIVLIRIIILMIIMIVMSIIIFKLYYITFI